MPLPEPRTAFTNCSVSALATKMCAARRMQLRTPGENREATLETIRAISNAAAAGLKMGSSRSGNCSLPPMGPKTNGIPSCHSGEATRQVA